MESEYINLTLENIAKEHICCAISDKKHAQGVKDKKSWLRARLSEGHVFRKLNAKGKVFIEYAPLKTAWVPVIGENYLYIYCLWVSGSFKGQGHAKRLLEYCIDDAKRQNKSGVCILTSKKKKPFLSDKSFMQKFGFEVCDTIQDYELLALSLDGTKPCFGSNVKQESIEQSGLVVFYSEQCPYIANCAMEVKNYCDNNNISVTLIKVDSVEKAKQLPCVFNNWAVFYEGKLLTLHLLNESYLKKLIKV